MGTENIAIIATFAVYLVALLVIGRLGERRHAGSYEDFVAADKSLGGWVTALSSASSSESVWVMLGLSGLAYWKGLAALWTAVGCVAGFAFNAAFVVTQLRRDSARLGSLTVSDWIEDRLGDDSGLLRRLSAVIITVFMLAYVVAQFTGAGDLFVGMEILGPDTPWALGVVTGAVIVGLYVVMGGYAAVCWTDALQGGLMFLVMAGLPVLAVIEAGGPAGVLDALRAQGLASAGGIEAGGWAAAGFVAGQLGIGLGYPGMPHMIVRYITVADDREARRAAWISVSWSVVVLFGSAAAGLAVRALVPDLADTQKAAEQLALPWIARTFLPAVASGVVLSAVTAAIMSTADSQLMYAATSLVNDLWLPLTGRRPGSEDAGRLVRATRGVILAMTGVALVFALLKVRLIYTFVLLAWGALGSAFGPIVVLGLYWRRLTRTGALASLVVGPLVTVTWHYTPALADALYELVPAFAASMVAAVVASLLTWEREGSRARPPGAA